MTKRMNLSHAALAEWGFSHIEVKKDGTILDVGCGGGAVLSELLKKAPEGKVIGIDYSEVSVAKSKKHNKNEVKSGRCEVFHGDVRELPFDEGSFDLVTAFETIYFWPQIESSFRQVHRVLKSGGTFMITNETNGKKDTDEKWVSMIEGMTIYNADEISNFLRETGFSKIRIDEHSNGWLNVVARKL